jgi:hypothetical protein
MNCDSHPLRIYCSVNHHAEPMISLPWLQYEERQEDEIPRLILELAERLVILKYAIIYSNFVHSFYIYITNPH